MVEKDRITIGPDRPVVHLYDTPNGGYPLVSNSIGPFHTLPTDRLDHYPVV